MKIHTFLLTVIAVATWSLPAVAASWREVSVTSDQVVYADTINVLRRGNFVRAWEREVYAAEQEGEGLTDLYKSVKVLTHYDCARRTSTPVIRIYYRSDGVEIRRFRIEGLMTPAPIEPDTPRDTIFGDLCPSKVAELAKAGITPVGEHAAKPHSDKPKKKDKKHAKSKSHKKVKSSKKAKSHGKVKSKKSAKHMPGPHEAHPVKGGRIEAAASRMDSVMTHEVHWTYDGATSPENWGDLKPEWARCGSGELQSPIDIRDGARLSLAPIKFEYRPSLLRLIDNGHTVQANYPGGSAITVGGTRYELLQMHFHKPSEARVNGRVYDMVAHIVHRSGDGRLAVVAVMFEIGPENTFINSLWPHLPLEKNREVILPDIKMSLDSLLPVNRGYYTFMGSLTTPPCTEGVLWMVMKSPVSISPNQVGVFSRLYPMNARPVQASNGRFIKESM